MFLHKHPYPPFIHNDTTKLICGTLPPPRFTTGDLLPNDVDFCYGSYYNSLWKYIDAIYKLNLRYDNSEEAISQRKQFLIEHNIGVCDIVDSCERDKIDASDLGMANVKLRDIIGYLKQFPDIDTLLFIGGNSKNGPEYFFRKHIKDYNLKLEIVDSNIPRIHQFILSDDDDDDDLTPRALVTERSQSEARGLSNRVIKTISLTSSSGAANRSIGSNPDYKAKKAKNPKYTTFDFRVEQYSKFI